MRSSTCSTLSVTRQSASITSTTPGGRSKTSARQSTCDIGNCWGKADWKFRRADTTGRISRIWRNPSLMKAGINTSSWTTSGEPPPLEISASNACLPRKRRRWGVSASVSMSGAVKKALRESGKPDEIIEAFRQSGYLYEADGATWFRMTDFGDAQRLRRHQERWRVHLLCA